MIEWIKQLTPEFYIVLGFLIILFILIIVQIIRLTIVSRRLGTQDFKLLDTINTDKEGKDFFQFVVSNQAFSTNNLNKMGFILHKNIIHELIEPNKLIPPRNKHVENFEMEAIEAITIIGVKKYKKIRLYAENDLGDKKESKGKDLNRYLKKKFKANKKAIKKALKEERFETGNYNFWERVGLVLKLFGRPFYKLNLRIKRKTNNALRESEVRREQKTKHDLIENELTQTAARVRNIQIVEESMRENKTRETELELLKQRKVLEIEKIKRAEHEKAFETRKTEILDINVEDEVVKYFKDNPIDYNKIDKEIIANVIEKIKQAEEAGKKAPKVPKKAAPEKEEPEVVEEAKEEKAPEKPKAKEEKAPEKPKAKEEKKEEPKEVKADKPKTNAKPAEPAKAKQGGNKNQQNAQKKPQGNKQQTKSQANKKK